MGFVNIHLNKKKKIIFKMPWGCVAPSHERQKNGVRSIDDISNFFLRNKIILWISIL